MTFPGNTHGHNRFNSRHLLAKFSLNRASMVGINQPTFPPSKRNIVLIYPGKSFYMDLYLNISGDFTTIP